MTRTDQRPPPDDEANWIRGVNAVTALVESRPGEVERVLVARGRERGLGRVLRQARLAGIPVSHVDRRILERRVGREPPHQGIVALAAARRYVPAEALCSRVMSGENSMLVLVDRVVDAGNLGALLRTAAAAGVAGVLLSSEDTVGVTASAVRASAGAAERIDVAREPAPSRRIQTLAEAGWSTVALATRGGERWDSVDLRGRIVFVAGGEERGPRPGVIQACRTRVSVPLEAGIESLNVAVALGVLLFEARRQRSLKSDGS